MTLTEFSRQYDILYDNIASEGARGINEYEKSVFLTIAQEQIVKSYYNGANAMQQGFENTEDKRRKLDSLVIPYTTDTIISDDASKINKNSKFFLIPLDVWWIVYERINTPVDSCGNSTIKVKPITHDDYNRAIDNPFRKPSKRQAWRMDVGKIAGNETVEIISEIPALSYYCRYLQKPSPIVLTDLNSDPELAGMNLSVDGVSLPNQCKLPDMLHRDILDRAVELSILKYRENNLQNNIEINKRNV